MFQFPDLAKLTFPGKKTFHNMDRRVLERRMKMLNDYLQTLLHSGVQATHPALRALLLIFLEPGDYDKGVISGHITKTVSIAELCMWGKVRFGDDGKLMQNQNYLDLQ